MKGILTAIISIILSAVLLASCGAAPNAQPSETSSADTETAELGSTEVTITFWHSASDQAGVIMDELVNDFNETNGKKITTQCSLPGTVLGCHKSSPDDALGEELFRTS